jgi:deuterolysin
MVSTFNLQINHVSFYFANHVTPISVSEIYDFSSAGTGNFSFNPNAAFKVASSSDASGKVQLSALQSVAPTVEPFQVEVTQDVARRSRFWMKRSTPECDDANKLDFITSSYSEGKDLASGASEYVSSGGQLVQDYFGDNSASDVSDILDAVANEDDSGRT